MKRFSLWFLGPQRILKAPTAGRSNFRAIPANPLALAALFLFCLLPFWAVQPAHAAPGPSLNDYLSEVRSKSPAYQALELTRSSTELRLDEPMLVGAPQLTAQIQAGADKTPPSNPAAGDETKANAYSLGVSQLFRFGLQAKLSYSLTYIDILNASTAFIPQPQAHTGKLALEFSQPLIRNGFGREFRALIDAGAAQAQAQKAAEAAKLQGALIEAEAAYLRLALAQGTLQLQKESLERAEKIRNWIQNRVSSNLADRADLLQAEAGVQGRTLELRITEGEHHSAQANFNFIRGSEAGTPTGELTSLPELLTSGGAAPQRLAERLDVQAARWGEIAAQQSARVGYERNLPQLDLFGTLASNGRAIAMGDATSQSFSSDKPTVAVGLKLSVPLDFGQLAQDRESYTKDTTAAELRHGRLLAEQEKNWSELNRNLAEARLKLEIAQKIEAIQVQKYARERERQSLGKTTTYFVLLFEQDLASARLNRLRSEAEVLNLRTQLKLFQKPT
jgi:outer membrane protein TolC